MRTIGAGQTTERHTQKITVYLFPPRELLTWNAPRLALLFFFFFVFFLRYAPPPPWGPGSSREAESPSCSPISIPRHGPTLLALMIVNANRAGIQKPPTGTTISAGLDQKPAYRH